MSLSLEVSDVLDTGNGYQVSFAGSTTDPSGSFTFEATGIPPQPVNPNPGLDFDLPQVVVPNGIGDMFAQMNQQNAEGVLTTRINIGQGELAGRARKQADGNE